MTAALRVTMAHPSAELYGSDLQLAETVAAFVRARHEVTVVLPQDGPLVGVLRERGARTEVAAFPVLRKSSMRPRGLVRLLRDILRAVPALWRRAGATDAVWVNTITIPWWLAVARLRGRTTVCHVHEAEDEGRRVVRTGLALPLLFARRVLCNSDAARTSLVSVLPHLAGRTQVVHNGVEGPPDEPRAPRDRPPGSAVRVALVGRWSPRKGIDVALEAVALLRDAGREVVLELCGSTFEGYEWYERELRTRADRPDLAGSVRFLGFVRPVWSVLDRADIVIVPSRVEPFGNTAVEAMAARRPLVASRTQGLREIVTDGSTGLQVEPGDPAQLADALGRLIDDPRMSRRLADAGRAEALSRFSPAGYGAAVTEVLATEVSPPRPR